MNKSELFYEQRLLERWLKRIGESRKMNIVHPQIIKTTNEFKTEVIEECPEETQFIEKVLPITYGGIDTYMWTVATFKELDPAKNYYGQFDFGTGANGLSVGAETLLYVGNKEVAGIDLNHKEVQIGKLASNQKLYFRSWSGIADETRLEELEYIQGKREEDKYHQVSELYLYELDEEVNNLYYNLFAMLEAYVALKNEDVNTATILISDLSKIFLKYDEADLNNELLQKLNIQLQQVIDDYPQANLIKMVAVGQTHIDLAWLWRVKHTREKAARSFATMLNLMDNNPEYTFFQSQPQLFEFLKEDYPQVYKRIQKYVVEGRIDIDGAMWLEADCNIPSGESLTRQILYGKSFITSEFEKDSSILWMPDVFGYSWAMPQILKKAGVDTFCTTKMQWNQKNRMPFNTFKWKGIDGTDINTHLIEDFSFYTINAKSMITGSKNYKDKDLSTEILYQYGFGDGGGGPRQEDIELVKRFDKIPGLPAIEYDTATNYFNELNSRIENSNSYVHTWDGELYLELHRGTFTSQAEIKKYNRKLEFKIRELEMRIAKAFQDGFNINSLHDKLTTQWKKLLLNQFHDIIPGSSINSVNVDAIILYKEISNELKVIESRVNDLYPKSEKSFAVFNSYNLPLTELISYNSDKQLKFYMNGSELEVDYKENQYYVVLPSLKPLAYNLIDVKYIDMEREKVSYSIKTEKVTSISDEYFSTKFYDIKFNESGHITYLYSKEIGRNIIEEGKVLNKLVSYEDKPLDWDAWDIDIYYKNRERTIGKAEEINIIYINKFETIIEFKFNHFNSTITQKISLSDLTQRIDITHNVDWHNPHRLLRVLCETGIRATTARYDIQYGNVERPTHSNTSWDMQKFEVLGHKWADISNNSYGISLLNDCKYGYSTDKDVLGLSLIKAAQFPDKRQDIGTHEYTYSIYAHKNNVLNSDIESEAFKLNNKLNTLPIDVDNNEIINLSQKNIAVDAIKVSEDKKDIIIRMHENKNTVSEFILDTEYVETDLLEKQVQKDNYIKSYEIKTIRIKGDLDD